MKKIWKQYYRHLRMMNRAKWYLDNIQPWSISMNQEYTYHKYHVTLLKQQLWANSEIY